MQKIRKIFVVGNSRSGTTMLGRVLDKHSSIYTFGELHYFEQEVDSATIRLRPTWTQEQLLAMLERLLTKSRDGFFTPVTPGKYRDLAQRVLSTSANADPISAYEAFLHFETESLGKQIPCEQTPRYLFFVAEILEAFPDALVINMVRDPRDVLLSQKNKWRRRFLGARNIPLREAFRAWANYHPYTIAKLWVAAVRMAKRHEQHVRFISIRFEDLLSQPEVTVRKLCDFLSIDFQSPMLEVPQVGSSAGQDQPDKLGIVSTRSNAWLQGGLSRTEVDICQRAAHIEMAKNGYEIADMDGSALKRWASMVQFVVKGFMALVLNLGRTRNLRETLRRRLGW